MEINEAKILFKKYFDMDIEPFISKELSTIYHKTVIDRCILRARLISMFNDKDLRHLSTLEIIGYKYSECEVSFIEALSL
jgi:hypothetical protein